MSLLHVYDLNVEIVKELERIKMRAFQELSYHQYRPLKDWIDQRIIEKINLNS